MESVGDTVGKSNLHDVGESFDGGVEESLAAILCVIGDATGESNHAMRARICITKKGRIVQRMV